MLVEIIKNKALYLKYFLYLSYKQHYKSNLLLYTLLTICYNINWKYAFSNINKYIFLKIYLLYDAYMILLTYINISCLLSKVEIWTVKNTWSMTRHSKVENHIRSLRF